MFDTEGCLRMATYHGVDGITKDVSFASWRNHYRNFLLGADIHDSRIRNYIPEKIIMKEGLSSVLLRTSIEHLGNEKDEFPEDGDDWWET